MDYPAISGPPRGRGGAQEQWPHQDGSARGNCTGQKWRGRKLPNLAVVQPDVEVSAGYNSERIAIGVDSASTPDRRRVAIHCEASFQVSNGRGLQDRWDDREAVAIERARQFRFGVHGEPCVLALALYAGSPTSSDLPGAH